MRAASRSFLLVPILLGACATPPPATIATGPDPMRVREIVANAASQVKRCYRPPRLNRAARRISTIVEVHFSVDGRLTQPPTVTGQQGVLPETRFEATLLAQAALDAVSRCAPLTLPPEYHAGGWDVFELTFGFAAVG